jgi:hypothetical protein
MLETSNAAPPGPASVSAAPVSSSFVLASLFFMLGFVVGGLVNESRRRRRRVRRSSSSSFAPYFPDDYVRSRSGAATSRAKR